MGGAASSLPAIRRRTGNEDVAPPVWLIPARSSQSKSQETIVPHCYQQSAKRIASVKVVFEGQETLQKKKNKNSACIENGDVVSYELQGRLGLRRVALAPRSAERKTDA